MELQEFLHTLNTMFYGSISGPRSSINHVPNSVLWKIFCLTYINLPSITVQVYHQISLVRNKSQFSSFSTSNRTSPSQAFLSMFGADRTFNSRGQYKSKCTDSSEKEISYIEVDTDDCQENLGNENDKEWQRRRKIGLANKGRVPWNKGKKHDMETRKRIKQRTIEALRDPKVRKKMAEHPRTHSSQVKVKISSSLRRVWAERLKKKRLNEKIYMSWRESIAIAARKGGKEQEELDWDSYDKIKEQEELERVKEKARVKEMKAEMAAKEKAEKRLAKNKKGDNKAKAEGKPTLSRSSNGLKRTGKEREKIQKNLKKLSVIERSRLKQRLKKIRKKISLNRQVDSRGSTATSTITQNTSWEKLDLELIRKGQMRKEKSLADQIQVAKTRKAESRACQYLHCLQDSANI